MSNSLNFKFSDDNLALAKFEIGKYPKGREKSALMALLYLAQKQNGGWLSSECLDYLARFLKIEPIKVYEVATFYTMFNLKPVGKFHLQVCGTTPCMLRGSEKLIDYCNKELGIKVGEKTADDLFSLSEVECLGGCANAPVVQINNDYFEDLDVDSFNEIIQNLKSGKKVAVGSQCGRKSSEPKGMKKK